MCLLHKFIRGTLIPLIAPPKMLLTQCSRTAQADLSRVCSLTSAELMSTPAFSGPEPTSHAAPSRLARALWSPAARRLGGAMFQGLPMPSAHRQQRRSLGGSSVQLRHACRVPGAGACAGYSWSQPCDLLPTHAPRTHNPRLAHACLETALLVRHAPAATRTCGTSAARLIMYRLLPRPGTKTCAQLHVQRPPHPLHLQELRGLRSCRS